MKILLTGGPSAGKTTIIQIIEREFSSSVVQVPESASLLFRGGFPRAVGSGQMIYQQRAIYYLQREIEDLIQSTHKEKVLVCDRGTLDGEAYWPEEGRVTFFESLRTTRSQELARYDWVLHLETPSTSDYDHSNPYRVENHKEAMLVNEKIKKSWSDHPNQILIKNSVSFSKKVERVLTVVEPLLKRHFEK